MKPIIFERVKQNLVLSGSNSILMLQLMLTEVQWALDGFLGMIIVFLSCYVYAVERIMLGKLKEAEVMAIYEAFSWN